MNYEINRRFIKEMYAQDQQLLRQKYPKIAAASQGVISIVATTVNHLYCGSGVVIEGDHVLTASHIVKGAERVQLFSSNLVAEIDVTGIILSDTFDCAVLPVPEAFRGHVQSLTMSSNLTGSESFLIGFPIVHESLHLDNDTPTILHVAAYPYLSSPYYLTVSIPDTYLEDPNGASGGAITNLHGGVVGIEYSSKPRFAYNGLRDTPVLHATRIEAIVPSLGIHQ